MITGLETEYGIMIEGGPSAEPTETAQRFFDFWRPTHLPSWEFATEQPSQEARGWLDLTTPLSPPETSNSPGMAHVAEARPSQTGDPLPAIALLDRFNFNAMLENGARFYIDHAHPEYSTPECLSLIDLIAADVAGQYFLAEVAKRNSQRLPAGQRFALYRNNTDFLGNSYGCHENYLMSTSAYGALFGNSQHRLFTFLIPFFVTRQIFCGSGKVGAETGSPTQFQISQRADFVETVIGLQTVWRRPIINTRDESHADSAIHRRLHVIVGDANMSEHATYLKVGVTSLVLEMLEAGCTPFNLTLADPVEAIKSVSRDLTCKKAVIALEGHDKAVSALDLQKSFLEQARRFLDERGATPDQEAIWDAWQKILAGLEEDPQLLNRRLDWVIKYQLLDSQRAKRGLTWESAILKEMDIKYHGIDPERSLYHRLVQSNLIDRVVTDGQVKERLAAPPPDTRATLRSLLLKALGPVTLAVNWDCITVIDAANLQLVRLRLPDPAQNGASFRDTLLAASDPLALAAQYFPIERFTLKTKENEPRSTTPAFATPE